LINENGIEIPAGVLAFVHEPPPPKIISFVQGCSWKRREEGLVDPKRRFAGSEFSLYIVKFAAAN
jgi:hypothetical protein